MMVCDLLKIFAHWCRLSDEGPYHCYRTKGNTSSLATAADLYQHYIKCQWQRVNCLPYQSMAITVEWNLAQTMITGVRSNCCLFVASMKKSSAMESMIGPCFGLRQSPHWWDNTRNLCIALGKRSVLKLNQMTGCLDFQFHLYSI